MKPPIIDWTHWNEAEFRSLNIDFNHLIKKTMKKLLFLLQIIAVITLYSSASYASGGHGKGHYKHKHKHHYQPAEEARYYPPQPQYPHHEDRRTTQGLAGGVVGSVVGYQVGNGNPLATGLGAAAGSLLGNEISGRR